MKQEALWAGTGELRLRRSCSRSVRGKLGNVERGGSEASRQRTRTWTGPVPRAQQRLESRCPGEVSRLLRDLPQQSCAAQMEKQ